MAVDPKRINEIVVAALEKETPEQRTACVAEACAGDAEMRQHVERLLRAHDESGGGFEPPKTMPKAAVDDDPHSTRNVPGEAVAESAAAPGTLAGAPPFSDPHVTSGPDEKGTQAIPAGQLPQFIDKSAGLVAGKYKLLQSIGEGGMGSVYMAEQMHPVKRMVAFKVIKAGMDTKQVLARFDAERQALALMDHPCIAKVLDAGTTETGQPYFVMELVKGSPLTKFCDERHLGVIERLKLFQEICHAVQHAHQKGIIHRDLKPGNILVESHDGRAVPKVIDFGLAKAINAMSLTDRSLFTNFGAVLGTPLYMAPEQAESSAIDVDTRADVYALGVILYELLTGTTPLERKRLASAAWDEIRRLIKEEEPQTPSDRLSKSDAQASIAARRQSEPAKLGKSVRGDLDWIVMKALSKERDRRYETANAFADDVERYLNDEPVKAGPPTLRYKFEKFVRRNKGRVVAASLILLALVFGFVGTTWGMINAKTAQHNEAMQRVEAERQRDAATEQRRRVRHALDSMTSQMTEDALAVQSALDPAQRAFLQEAAAQYQKMASDSADDLQGRKDIAGAKLRLGRIYQRLGDHKAAEPALKEAAAQFAALATEDPAEGKNLSQEIAAEKALVILLVNQRRYPEADVLAPRMAALSDQLVADQPANPEYRMQQAESHSYLQIALGGLLDERKADPAQSEKIKRRVVAILNELVTKHPHSNQYRAKRADARHGLAEVFFEEPARKAEVEELMRQAQAELKQVANAEPDKPEYKRMLGRNHNHFGEFLEMNERRPEAEAEFRQAIAVLDPLEREQRGDLLIAIDAGAARTIFGRFALESNDAKAAVDLFSDAIRSLNKVMIMDSRREFPRRMLAFARVGQAKGLIRLGRVPEAISAADAVVVLVDETPDLLQRFLLEVAGVYSLAAASSEGNEHEKHATQAIIMLRRARAAGYFKDAKKIAQLKADTDLASLRERQDFKKMVDEMEKEAAAKQ